MANSYWDTDEGIGSGGNYWGTNAGISAPSPSAPTPEPVNDDRGFVDRITSNYDSLIDGAATRYGIDPHLGKSIAHVESSGKADAYNKDSGAAGLFQMTPIAVEEVNRLYGTNYNLDDRFDPAKAADMGMAYFAAQLDKAKGDTELALRYYNGGYDQSKWGPQNAAYAGKVFNQAMHYNAGDQNDLARGFSQGLKGYFNDSISGMQGVSNAVQGFDAGENYWDYLNGQDAIAQTARPQDQLSGAINPDGSRNWGEILGDTLPTSIGSGLGSSAVPLTAGLAGLAMGGPIGGAIGLGASLIPQMLGNTWAESTAEDMRKAGVDPNKASADQFNQAAGMDTGETARVMGYGLGRAGLEGLGDVALGGLGGLAGLAGKAGGKLLPSFMGGKSTSLLNSPLGRVGAGIGSESLQEVGDTYLTAAGSGAGVGSVTGEQVGDAAFGGAAGGGGMVAGQQMLTNPFGMAAQVRGLADPNYRPNYDKYASARSAFGGAPVPSDEYNRNFYQDSALREQTRNASEYIRQGVSNRIQEQAAARAQAEADAAAAAEAARPRTKSELVKAAREELQAEYERQLELAKTPKITKEDYAAVVDEWLNDPANEGKDYPAELASLGDYQKFRKAEHEQQNPKPKEPTLADAFKRVNEQFRDESPARAWQKAGDPQLDMWGNEYGSSPRQEGTGTPLALAPIEGEAADTTDPRQMELDLRNGYVGTRLLPRLGAGGTIALGQEPEQGRGGQLDMFGGRGPDVAPEDVATVASTEVDPNQESIPFPVNDRASGAQYEAAFNRAEREAQKQKARDEADAAGKTKARNTATVSALTQENPVAAEAEPDIGLGIRQVKRINKAQEQARAAQEEADRQQKSAKENWVDEVNKNLGSEQIRYDDELDTNSKSGAPALFPVKHRRGRPPKGKVRVPIYRGDTVVGHVLRNKPEVVEQAPPAVTEDVGPNADQIIADKLAEQAALLEKKTEAKKPEPKKVEAKQEVSGKDVDDFVSKIGKMKFEPRQKLSEEDEALLDEVAAREAAPRDEVTGKPTKARKGEVAMLDFEDDNDLSGTEYGDMFNASEDYSLTEDGKAKTPTDKGAIDKTVEALTGKDSSWKVQVHKTVAAAERALGRTLKKNAKAFVTGGKAHFILENIPKGSELGVFLHEVGAHLGMERILTGDQQGRLANKINQWAESGKGVEGEAARAALKKAGDNPREAIAYFVEEAVNRGVNPTALDMKSDLGRWFRQLWAAMKTALRKLGIKNIDNLSAQDVVNLAYGAARLELSGNWHGSAKNFNKFSNKYRGTGEGGLQEGADDFRDMIAFGQYFAGKRGTAEGYRDRIGAQARRSVGLRTRQLAKRADEFLPALKRALDKGVKVDSVPLWSDGSRMPGDDMAALTAIGHRTGWHIFKDQIEWEVDPDWQENAAEAIKVIKNAQKQVELNEASPTLFNVDFNIKNDEWLDWDFDLDEQSEKVQAATRSLIKDSWGDPVRMAARRAGVSPISLIDGSRLYRNLAQELGSEKAASEYLNSIGVKGVRYLDAQSRRRGEGTYNYVVFDPKNVVVGNKNSPRTESDDIQYSVKDFVAENIAPNLQKKGDVIGDALTNILVKAHNIPYLAKWRPDLKSLQDLHKSEKDMQASYGAMMKEVESTVDDYRELKKPVQTKLGELMLMSTMMRIHPDLPFNHELNSHLTEKDRSNYDDLQVAWRNVGRMDPKAHSVYKKTRQAFLDMQKRRMDALNNLVDDLVPGRGGQVIKEILQKFERRAVGPYFPIVRFGSHVAVWKSQEYLDTQETGSPQKLSEMQSDPDHYRVSFEDSEKAAWRQVAQWRDEVGDTRDDDRSGYAQERAEYGAAVNPGLIPLIDKMQATVGNALRGADAAQIAEAKEAIGRNFIMALPDTHILVNSLKRRGVAGAKPEEVLRGIAQHGGSQAFHISRLEHSGKTQRALNELRKENVRSVNSTGALSVYSGVADGMRGMYTEQNPTAWSKGIAAASSALFHSALSLNPSFWAISAMTPAIISTPYMTARHKTAATYSAWWRGMRDAASILKFGNMDEYLRFSFASKIEQSRLTQDEKDMLSAVEAAGGIDQSAIREVANIAKHNVGTGDTATRFISGMAHRAEVMSRISTALAAYRLEKARTGSAEQATKYAIEVIDNTLVNYSEAHTPLLLRNARPETKAFFQFARYQFAMNALILHNFREAWGSDLGIAKPVDAKTKAEARKKFWALLSAHSVTTGASGLFGLKAVVFATQLAINTLMDDDDEIDLEEETRKWLDAALGKKGSTAVRKGLPALLGLDLSERMGMGGMLTPRRDNPFSGDRHKMAENAVNMVPALSHTFAWIDWMKNPTFKGMPVSMIANIAKGMELSSTGMVNTHGVVKKGAEDFNGFDIMLQTLGFTPTEKTEAFARQDSDRRQKEAVGSTRQELLDQLYAAMRDKDKAKIEELRDEIRNFTGRHQGEKEARITGDTIKKSFRQRRRREAGMDEYGVEQ